MEIKWEECEIPAPASGALNVTVGPGGEITIGANTYKKFGKPDAVVLMYDKANGLVGLRAAEPSVPNAYPLMPVENWGHRIVRACRFWNHIGIRHSARTRFASPRIENGVLILDLSKAYPLKTRQKRAETGLS